jgi:hypothetical protein
MMPYDSLLGASVTACQAWFSESHLVCELNMGIVAWCHSATRVFAA